MGDLKTSLIIPDIHAPYHSKRALNLCFEVASYVGIDDIKILGDFEDFYCIHDHGPKDPRLIYSIEKEVEAGNLILDEIDRLWPRASKALEEGNHCFRYERFLLQYAPQLLGMLSVQKLLRMHERKNWKWVAYTPHQKDRVLNSNLWVKHTPLGASALATVKNAMCNIAYGHIHRRQYASIKGLTHNYEAWCPGWLGDKTKSVFNFVKNHNAWQLGFALVYVEKSGQYHKDIVEITDNFTCVVNGKRFKG